MKDVLFALIASGLGLALCFFGYRLARVLIPLWGFFVGFSIGAAGTSDAFNNAFLGTTMGIVVGLFVGLLFALLAYFFYSLAVVLFMASLGYWIGTSIVLFFGLDKGFLSATIGIVVGAILGIIALFTNMPKLFLIVGTSIAGSVAVFGGVLVLFNKIQLDAFSYAAASEAISASWLLSLPALALMIVAIIFQLRTNPNYTLEEWGTITGPKNVDSTLE